MDVASKCKTSSSSSEKHYAEAKPPRDTGKNFKTGPQHGGLETLDLVGTPGFCVLSPSVSGRKAAVS